MVELFEVKSRIVDGRNIVGENYIAGAFDRGGEFFIALEFFIELHVHRDGLRFAFCQRIDDLGEIAARPGPVQAGLREGFIVNANDDDIRRGRDRAAEAERRAAGFEVEDFERAEKFGEENDDNREDTDGERVIERALSDHADESIALAGDARNPVASQNSYASILTEKKKRL